MVATEVAYLAAAAQLDAFTSIPLFGGFLAFETALLVLAACAAGATAFAEEKETNTLDVLRVTPLTPLQILRGKVAGLLRGILPSLAVPCVHLILGIVSGILAPAAVPAYLVAGAVVSATWALIGMSMSLDQRDPQRAVRRTMGILAIFGGLVAGYLGFMIHQWAKGGLEEWISWTLPWGANPLGAMLGAVAPFRTGGSTAETTLLAGPSRADAAIGAITCLAWLVLHAFAALFVLRRLAHLYRTRFEG
jgi:ABC-type Na+ efflux pump permease subunit